MLSSSKIRTLRTFFLVLLMHFAAYSSSIAAEPEAKTRKKLTCPKVVALCLLSAATGSAATLLQPTLNAVRTGYVDLKTSILLDEINSTQKRLAITAQELAEDQIALLKKEHPGVRFRVSLGLKSLLKRPAEELSPDQIQELVVANSNLARTPPEAIQGRSYEVQLDGILLLDEKTSE